MKCNLNESVQVLSWIWSRWFKFEPRHGEICWWMLRLTFAYGQKCSFSRHWLILWELESAVCHYVDCAYWGANPPGGNMPSKWCHTDVKMMSCAYWVGLCLSTDFSTTKLIFHCCSLQNSLVLRYMFWFCTHICICSKASMLHQNPK